MDEHSGFENWLKNELLIRKINPETYPSFINLMGKLPGPTYVVELLNVIDQMMNNELWDIRDWSELEI